MECRTLARYPGERGVHKFVLRIGAACDAQENVRIDETRSNRHLIVVLIYPIARDCFR
jgi:hypothetical protein